MIAWSLFQACCSPPPPHPRPASVLQHLGLALHTGQARLGSHLQGKAWGVNPSGQGLGFVAVSPWPCPSGTSSPGTPASGFSGVHLGGECRLCTRTSARLHGSHATSVPTDFSTSSLGLVRLHSFFSLLMKVLHTCPYPLVAPPPPSLHA